MKSDKPGETVVVFSETMVLFANIRHSVHWGINPPHPPPYVLKIPLLYLQTVQVPFFSTIPHLYIVFCDPLPSPTHFLFIRFVS